MEFFRNLAQNPFFILAVTCFFGIMLGRIKVKQYSLGGSGILFVGIFISELLHIIGIQDMKIPRELFILSLIGFIVAVGLEASKNLVKIVKLYGLRFMVLALVVTSTAAGILVLSQNLFPDLKYELVGSYAGSLTSSPGLANALETVKNANLNVDANVGLGYALAYLPGVIGVIIFSQIMGKKGGKPEEKLKAIKEVEIKEFDLKKFMFVIIVGLAIGSIKLNIAGMTIGLGSTGGVLLSTLILGSTFKSFKFNTEKLDIIKLVSLYSFLAIIGINYGHRAISEVSAKGPQLLAVSLIIVALSTGLSYLFGKYILKIEHNLLIGGICGGMTSTPGLASAYEATDDKNVVTGYGATYPFGLIFTIVFLKFLV